jgi:hypothetical protein
VEAQDFVLVQGLRDTRATLERWNERPGAVLWSWLAGSLAVVVALLLAVWVVATLSTPDPNGLALPGLNRPASLGAVGWVLFRNSLVLALHAMACVAGFIAGSSLPLEATKHTGLWRWVHDKAGPLAIGFVVCATTFSLATQAFVLGSGASTLAAQLGISPALLLVGLVPHALPELTVLFLPLAAWIIASRRNDWHQLLAATFVTVGIAVPVLVVSAFVEVYVSPHLLKALAF